LLRFISDLFRNRRPVLKAGQSALVFRNADVLDALNRDEALTIKEVNAARMDRISGPFVLGMDRSPQFDREDAAIMGVIKPGDLERIGRIVREAAEELIGAAWGLGRIDVAQEYSYPIAARVVEQYFGTPGPSEGVLIQWMHSLFWDVFQNRNNQQLVRRAADVSALELRNYLVELIPSRRGSKADDLLSRLVQSTGLDDEAVRRNITGIIVGAIDTTVTAVVSVMDELLKQPKAMELARAAAMANDIDRLRLCCFEALRYQPQTPALLRRSHSAVTLCSGKVIPGNSNVVLLTISAMFDPEAFPNPDVFRDDRPLDRYLHFGHGMHTCYGRHFNAVQIPEQVGCLLRAGAVRRESRVGFSGPFPDRLVVGFGR
jgi:cytochrome P450